MRKGAPYVATGKHYDRVTVVLVGRSRLRVDERFVGRLGEAFATADRVDVGRVDADTTLGSADWFEAHDAIDLGIDGVVLADADVLTDPELGSALANHDRSRT